MSMFSVPTVPRYDCSGFIVVHGRQSCGIAVRLRLAREDNNACYSMVGLVIDNAVERRRVTWTASRTRVSVRHGNV